MVLRNHIGLITGVLVFGTDQLSKLLVVHWLNLRELGAIEVLPPILNFRMGWNRGINFGLFAGDSDILRWILVAVALMISGWVIWWVHQDGSRPLSRLSAGLLVGGALGNVLDRLIYGAVADFLNMSCCGFENPTSFNVADISIFAGAIGLVIFADGGKSPGDGAKKAG